MVKRRQLRLLGAALLLVAAAPLVAPTPRAQAAGLAGQWNALAVLDCKPNALNAALCKGLLGNSWITREIISFQALCNASGVCSFTDVAVLTANQPGAGSCSSPAAVPFQGTCSFVYSGKAHIGQSAFGVPGFIEDSATGVSSAFPGVTLIPDPKTLPFDLGVPALPGSYPNTALNLQLLSILPANTPAPPGVTFTAVETQDTAATSIKPVSLALPLPLDTSGPGVSASFVVGWFSSKPGQGSVEFGSGPGCNGLVETATQDWGVNTAAHVVTVSGNELPGAVGDAGILPGATYQYQTATASPSGQELDNNGGKCYGVAIPKS